MELIDIIKKAEQENEDLHDFGDIPTRSYKIFKELIDKVKEQLGIEG
jgi:hypothetical protein